MFSNLLKSNILSKFPRDCAFCFAYGSGVKKQSGYTDAELKDTLIDLMFCVDDPRKWHEENLLRNKSDYSFMRCLSPSTLAYVQRNYGAKVYCNTLVTLESGCAIKYGVIATEDLCNDLNHWTDLYVAGRLHKPITTLIPPNSDEINDAIAQNLQNAIRTALILLPERFTYFDLFYEIAQMSYKGDFRMTFGEKKDKVRNIVQPQIEAFGKLYLPHLRTFESTIHLPKTDSFRDETIKQDKSTKANVEHMKLLPTTVRQRLVRFDGNVEQKVRKAMAQIVGRSSKTQSLKNIPTAGLMKSIKYSWRKALKTFS